MNLKHHLAKTLVVFFGLTASSSATTHKLLSTATSVVKQDASISNMPLGNLDLDSPPLPRKYAHPLRTISLTRNKMPSGPGEAKASQLYSESQDLQQKGFAWLMYGFPQKAILKLNQSRILWPDSAATYRWLAESYEANGQPKEAISNYRLLFYGWPGKYVAGTSKGGPKELPLDKPSDYDQPNPEESDPTLLMQFSFLLQQTKQYTEAQVVYERGMQVLSAKVIPLKEPLPPALAVALTTPQALEAATRTALAINEITYQDKEEAKENLRLALQLQSDSAEAMFYQQRLTKEQKPIN